MRFTSSSSTGLVTPSDRQLEALISLCESTDFSHRAEVLSLLTDAEAAARLGARIDVDEGGGTIRDLASTYRTRAAHLTQLEERGTLTDPSATGRRLPVTLAADVRKLSAALDAAGEQSVRIWSIRLADRTAFIIFVLLDDQVIAGAVKSVSEAPWEGLPSESS
jgi:hypothetical protein